MTKKKKKLGKWIIPSCKIYMMEEETLGRGPKGGGKEELEEEELSLTQYLKSQEDQDITRLLNFTRTQERGRDEVFCVSLE